MAKAIGKVTRTGTVRGKVEKKGNGKRINYKGKRQREKGREGGEKEKERKRQLKKLEDIKERRAEEETMNVRQSDTGQKQ